MLTLFRILLVPAFLIAVIYDRLPLALLLFLAAGGTDLLDGFLARRLGQETVLGVYLDPVADKLLMTVSFVALAINGILPAWLAVLVVTKDLFVSIGIGILFFAGQPINAVPTLWGKQTTFLQIITVVFALFAAMNDTPIYTLFSSDLCCDRFFWIPLYFRWITFLSAANSSLIISQCPGEV